MESTGDFDISCGVLIQYRGAGGNVTVPEGVTGIGFRAFCGCEGLTGLTLPEGVRYIDDYAFEDCRRLREVVFSDSVTDFGDGVFDGCNSLHLVRLPDNKVMVRRKFLWNLAYYAWYVICYTARTAALVAYYRAYPVYLGGPLSDLNTRTKRRAIKGFYYAKEKGIAGIDRWEDSYLDYIRRTLSRQIEFAGKNRNALLVLIRGGILDEGQTETFIRQYMGREDPEVMAALLQYKKDRFGEGGLGDLSL